MIFLGCESRANAKAVHNQFMNEFIISPLQVIIVHLTHVYQVFKHVRFFIVIVILNYVTYLNNLEGLHLLQVFIHACVYFQIIFLNLSFIGSLYKWPQSGKCQAMGQAQMKARTPYKSTT